MFDKERINGDPNKSADYNPSDSDDDGNDNDDDEIRRELFSNMDIGILSERLNK